MLIFLALRTFFLPWHRLHGSSIIVPSPLHLSQVLTFTKRPNAVFWAPTPLSAIAYRTGYRLSAVLSTRSFTFRTWFHSTTSISFLVPNAALQKIYPNHIEYLLLTGAFLRYLPVQNQCRQRTYQIYHLCRRNQSLQILPVGPSCQTDRIGRGFQD